MARLARLIALVSIVLLGLPLAARADDIHVTTTGDSVNPDTACSLREAIFAANSDTAYDGCSKGNGTDRVLLDPGHYVLMRNGFGEDGNNVGDLDISGQLTIVGSGAANTSIDASGFMPAQADRVIEVRPGADATLEDLTVTGGHAPDGFDALPKTGLPGNPGETVVGNTGDPGANGGGMFNQGTLTLLRVSVTGNHAGDGGAGGAATGGSGDSCACDAGNAFGGPGGLGGNGGGIANFGTLTVDTSTISGNDAGTGGDGGDAQGGAGGALGAHGGRGGDGTGGLGGLGGWGGGIFNAGTVTVERSSILGNFAGDGGGGGSGTGASGGVGSSDRGADGLGDGSSGNQGGFGGGIADSPDALTPLMTISDSTLAGNGSGSGGIGAVGIGGSPSGNSFGGSGGDGGYGGGLLFRGNGDKVSNSTFTTNITGAGGGGAFAVQTSTGTATDGHDGAGKDGFAAASFSVGVSLEQDTLSGNGVLPGPPVIVLGGGGPAAHTTLYVGAGALTVSNSIIGGECGQNGGTTLTDGGHNLAPDGAGCPGAPGDPKLASLTDNGGPTQTMALTPGSAAIDKIPVTGAGCPPTDQRGVARPQFAACDIGAFELTPAPPGGDSVAPTVSHVSVSPRRFAVGAKPTPVSAKRRKVHKGTKISFQLSEAAQVKLAFQRKLPGIKLRNKAGKQRCAQATKRNRRALLAQVKKRLGAKANGPGAAGRIKKALRKARCSRFATKGTLNRAEQAGANIVAFSGRVGKKPLRPGAYRVRLTGTDAAGNRSRAAAAAFKVVKG